MDVRTISEHIKNIFSDEELERDPTNRKFRIVQKEGGIEVERNITHYGERCHGEKGVRSSIVACWL